MPPRPRLQSSQGGTGSVAAGWDFYVGETRKGYVGVGNESVGFGAGELLLLGGTGNKTSLWAGYNRGVTVDTNGNVGIGTSGPGFKLDVADRAHATSFLNSSDDRLKNQHCTAHKRGGEDPEDSRCLLLE